jgi:hypothetical protein
VDAVSDDIVWALADHSHVTQGRRQCACRQAGVGAVVLGNALGTGAVSVCGRGVGLGGCGCTYVGGAQAPKLVDVGGQHDLPMATQEAGVALQQHQPILCMTLCMCKCRWTDQTHRRHRVYAVEHERKLGVARGVHGLGGGRLHLGPAA